jgi:hypothetical protein
MSTQVGRWEANPEYRSWYAKTKASHIRCSETRVVQKLSKSKNPPVSSNPNTACRRCVLHGNLWVLVGNYGSVVVPLPVADRPPGAPVMQGNLFIKTRVAAPVILPQPTTWSADTFFNSLGFGKGKRLFTSINYHQDVADD